jgi:uncharacterized protein
LWDVDYEWDDVKEAENRRKHGVDFADAIAALEDPNRLEEIDTQPEHGEERIRVTGMAHDKILFVDHHITRRGYLQDHIGPEGHTT